MMACRAALLESARKDHQLMSLNDKMPTPSQPTNNMSKLLAEIRRIIIRIKIRRWLKKLVILGSEYMYALVNSMIDHVTNKAVGIKKTEKVSTLRPR